MRLQCVETGHRLPSRLFLGAVRRRSGGHVPDVLKVLTYRPEFFGVPFVAPVQQSLRGESEWSVGERELFATFTSSLNQCPF